VVRVYLPSGPDARFRTHYRGSVNVGDSELLRSGLPGG
jgi:hypothetical protein